MKDQDSTEVRSKEIVDFFNQLLNSANEQGDIGFAKFSTVYDELMPIQKEKLRTIVGSEYESLMHKGSMISFGVTYRDSVIDYIDRKEGEETDYQLWNKYALEYHRLNQIINQMSKDIASQFDGIPLTATIGGVIDKIKHVADYFNMVISHRVVAENAGIGWRGKNQLTIHEQFSCAIRFATVIIPYPLNWSSKSESKCGVCIACEEVCSFIKHRNILPDYRENCRRYILFLKSNGIEKDICGKCIKACYQSSIFQDTFSLST
jgi:epoxyqueuosine reductase QueG